jgi:hypothetical protein
MRAMVIPSAALAVTVAGCGGGSSGHYNVSEVRDCLSGRVVSVTSQELPGDVSPDGSEGNLTVHVGHNELVLAFGRDASEAKSNAGDQRVAAGNALGADADDSVRTRGNVAYWVVGTETTAFDAVESCLN